MLFIVRPVLNKRFGLSAKGAQLSSGFLAFAFITLLLSAWITEMIGIHALFGAFLMDVVMPEQNEFKEKLTARIQGVTTLILLPLFFTFTGLRTQIGLACALAGKANLIVSRDLDLLRLKRYGTIGIMSPIDFLHTLEGFKKAA